MFYTTLLCFLSILLYMSMSIYKLKVLWKKSYKQQEKDLLWLSASGKSSLSKKLSLLWLASYHILILIAFIISLPSGGVAVLDSELHHAAERAGHCGKQSLCGQEIPSLQGQLFSSTGQMGTVYLEASATLLVAIQPPQDRQGAPPCRRIGKLSPGSKGRKRE